MPQATRCRDGRQEGRERGYYHLHRKLNNPLSFHCLFSFLFCHTDLTDPTDIFLQAKDLTDVPAVTISQIFSAQAQHLCCIYP